VFAALIVTAWWGGRGPALLSLFVGAMATSYFVVPPRFSFALGQIEYRVGLTPYLIVGLALIALFELLHNKGSRLELEVEARRAAEQVLADRE
jgi:K+-sensing histidine kinase KdpD